MDGVGSLRIHCGPDMRTDSHLLRYFTVYYTFSWILKLLIFCIVVYIIIIITNQPKVKESCPDGNDTLNSRVELQPLTRVCVGLMDHIGFEFLRIQCVCQICKEA